MDWYHHKWFPRFFYKKNDGGVDSVVVGYFLIEWKPVFSIGILSFDKGSRENYHSHAFNAITWWLSGKVEEINWKLPEDDNVYKPSIIPKVTLRSKIHKIFAYQKSWALTFRGPWKDTWFEVDKQDKMIQYTHGRVKLPCQ